ncbi:biotin/lipoyl-binding protein [uncultured Cohaesibacter sp.]|uniref:biotin/lipoyl-binding protein n=1 Tax=uncultured Cohaesibacter sp. TaxID=1002546 RepID=UPI002930E4AC|nr:biotin/lipoyl-binding protein [uncultured Cohaesibacter sp.]
MTIAETTDLSLRGELRKHFLIALILGLGIIGGLFIWASLAEISSAVVASGSIVVEGNTKRVQHHEGGIVKDILVKEGDHVEAGDILIRLDDTLTQANLAIVTKQLAELRVQAARLLAERDGKPKIKFPTIEDVAFGSSELIEIRQGHARLMASRQKSLMGRKSQLEEQIKQLRSQIDGLIVQRDAKADEISLIQEDITAYETLREKDLVTKSSLNRLKREKAEMEGEYGEFVSSIAQVRQAVSEKQFSILQLKEDSQADILEQ